VVGREINSACDGDTAMTQRWIIQGCLAERDLVMVSGRNRFNGASSSGKSLFCHWLCVRIAFGFDLPELVPTTGILRNVLYLSFQESRDELKRRQVEAQKEMSSIDRMKKSVEVISLRGMSNDDEIVELAWDAIAESQPDVIVLDGINAVSKWVTETVSRSALTRRRTAVILVSPDEPAKSGWYYEREVDAYIRCAKDVSPREVCVEIDRVESPNILSWKFCHNNEGALRRVSVVMAAGVDKETTGRELVTNYSRANRRRGIAPRLRYRILEMARFRCVACGSSSNDGVTLHIDHIIPVSRGGSSDESNLQVLCQPCNLGKSDMMPRQMAPRLGEAEA